jgi:hypothetical protein
MPSPLIPASAGTQSLRKKPELDFERKSGENLASADGCFEITTDVQQTVNV